MKSTEMVLVFFIYYEIQFYQKEESYFVFFGLVDFLYWSGSHTKKCQLKFWSNNTLFSRQNLLPLKVVFPAHLHFLCIKTPSRPSQSPFSILISNSYISKAFCASPPLLLSCFSSCLFAVRYWISTSCFRSSIWTQMS